MKNLHFQVNQSKFGYQQKRFKKVKVATMILTTTPIEYLLVYKDMGARIIYPIHIRYGKGLLLLK